MSPELREALRRLDEAMALPEDALMRQFLVNTALFEAADAYNIARSEGPAPKVPEAVALSREVAPSSSSSSERVGPSTPSSRLA